MRRIEGDPAWFFAWSDGPVCDDFMLRRVDRDDLALILDIAVDASPAAIDSCEFRTASKRNGT